MNQIIDQTYRVAIYLRLSKDDGDFSLSGGGKTEKIRAGARFLSPKEGFMPYKRQYPSMEVCNF